MQTQRTRKEGWKKKKLKKKSKVIKDKWEVSWALKWHQWKDTPSERSCHFKLRNPSLVISTKFTLVMLHLCNWYLHKCFGKMWHRKDTICLHKNVIKAIVGGIIYQIIKGNYESSVLDKHTLVCRAPYVFEDPTYSSIINR